MIKSTPCSCCAFRNDSGGCVAFPDGIPNGIYWGNFDHRKPYPGDHGIRFEPRHPGDADRYAKSFPSPEEMATHDLAISRMTDQEYRQYYLSHGFPEDLVDACLEGRQSEAQKRAYHEQERVEREQAELAKPAAQIFLRCYRRTNSRRKFVTIQPESEFVTL